MSDVEIGGISTSPVIPNIEVRFEHLSYKIKQSQTVANAVIPTVGSTLAKMALGPFMLPLMIAKKILNKKSPAAAAEEPPKVNDFVILDDVSGVLRPGTLTLLLAPPGHGKSALLKTLAGVLPAKELTGNVTYSGISAATAHAGNVPVHIGSLCQYVNQVDEHLAQLTVRETFDFVRDSCAVDPSEHGFPHLAAQHKGAVDDIIDLLHLNNCKNTVIGNDLLRGVSGGEKKRVTVGEGLLTAARFLALDEISTGLDSAVTFDIVKRLRSRASDQGLTVIASLLQPTPETFGLFDEVMLLREGACVYHGPREALPSYLTSLGFAPPTIASAEAAVVAGGAAAPAGGGDTVSLDLADWLIQFLSDPEKLLALTAPLAPADDASDKHTTTAAAAVTPPTTTAALAAAWRSSELSRTAFKRAPCAAPLKLEGSYAIAQYSRGYAHSQGKHLSLLLRRQLILMRRNLLYVRSRIMSALLMSIILGGLYWQRTIPQGMTFFGTFLNCLMIMGFANLSEMAAAVENKYIAYRHVANGFFPPQMYVLTSAITHIPVAIVECFIFTGIIYGMTGMGPSSSGYFFLWGTVCLFNIMMRNLLCLFALQGKTLQASQAAPLPIIALMIVFGGFLVVRSKMGWLLFMSYIDPIAWALRSLAVNEFQTAKYAIPIPGSGGVNVGEYFLAQFDIPSGTEWKWAGPGFLIGAIILILGYSIRVFGSVRFDRNIGSGRKVAQVGAGGMKISTSRIALPRVATAETFANTVTLREPNSENTSSTTTTQALPFTPMTVAFSDITYLVNLPKHLGGGEKTLLRGITGVAKPGRLLALMGASGAGKTTLLDVLGGRKNSGVMTGRISLNGFEKETRTFNRVTAYCEQSDVHMPLATVREALLFSAQLRLPSDISSSRREAFVDEVLALLELTSASGRLVGIPGSLDGLAPHERKRLTIGVELVSNAPVLFLDEPTSGLDSRAAAIVMQVIRRVASTGRTVICTIHQPSAEIFFAFDDLLLLQRGGWQVYFGPLGRAGVDLINYLSALPNMSPPPVGMNPASWMLDALQGLDSKASIIAAAAATAVSETTTDVKGVGEGTSSSPLNLQMKEEETQNAFFKSSAGLTALAAVEVASSPREGVARVSFPSHYAVGFHAQASALLTRHAASYWRNVGLNVGRLVALCVLNLMCVTLRVHCSFELSSAWLCGDIQR